MVTHYRCGGTLHPELHDRWSLTYTHEPKISGTEILHRCDRCNLIGVSVPAPAKTFGQARVLESR